MALPSGFDPATGTFTGLSSPRVGSSRNSTSSGSSSSWDPAFGYFDHSYHGRRRSLWSRFNDAIKSAGNWIDDRIEPVSGWITVILAVIGIIGLVIWIFSDFKIINIILRIIGACIIGYIAAIGLGIASFFISLALKVVRFIFWNGWTLLIALTILSGNFAFKACSSLSQENPTPQTETVVTTYPEYECTASVLNVRSQPSQSSSVIGTLKNGDRVEVLEITGNYARFNFKGRSGYASLSYLRKTD